MGGINDVLAVRLVWDMGRMFESVRESDYDGNARGRGLEFGWECKVE